MEFKKIITPFSSISKLYIGILLGIQIVLTFAYFEVFKSPIFPKPSEVFTQIFSYLTDSIFYDNLFSTLIFLIQSLLFSIIATMVLSYAWTIQLFKPLVNFLIKCRYLPFNCVVFIFTSMVSEVESVKYALLVFGLVPYFTTSMVAIITDVQDGQKLLNKSFINKKDNWATLYEVIIVGKLDQIFEVIRQNFAIAWTMLTAVEAMALGSGGLGTMIVKSQKHVELAQIFAIAIIILVIGIGIDYGIKSLRKIIFPYVNQSKK